MTDRLTGAVENQSPSFSTVWAVVWDSAFPREVDSLWTKEGDAQKRAEELGYDWEVVEMPVMELKPESGSITDVDGIPF